MCYSYDPHTTICALPLRETHSVLLILGVSLSVSKAAGTGDLCCSMLSNTK